MGDFVAERYVGLILSQLNFRFAPGDALTEVVAFQKAFKVFSPDHALKRSFALLNLAPQDEKQRRGFFRYLDRLKTVGSSVDGLDGQAGLIAALQRNLESKSPMPVFFTVHAATRGQIRVEVSTSTPITFSATKYVTVSFPTLRDKE